MWAQSEATKSKPQKKSMIDEARHKLFEAAPELPDFVPKCMMIYGQDNTAKTGLALSVLTDEDVKEGKKIVVIDLDLGCMPLLIEYYADKVYSGNIIYVNPIKWTEDENGTPIVDYKATIDEINAIGVAIREKWKEENVKAVIFDGGSKFLKYAEQQMRIEKAITPDGGVSQRYWIVRNKMFIEALELYKSLPVHKVFIFHDNFIPEARADRDISSVVLQTNQMMFQKIYCERIDSGAVVRFRATIHKSKGDITLEGKSVEFATVNKEEGSFEWNPEKVLSLLNFT